MAALREPGRYHLIRWQIPLARDIRRYDEGREACGIPTQGCSRRVKPGLHALVSDALGTYGGSGETTFPLYRQTSLVRHPPQLPAHRGVPARPCEQHGERLADEWVPV